MSTTQLSDKLDYITNMLLQITEHLKQLPMPQLLEQIEKMTDFFKSLPGLLQTSTSISTDEIIAEIKIISHKLERLQSNPEKGESVKSNKYYRPFWK